MDRGTSAVGTLGEEIAGGETLGEETLGEEIEGGGTLDEETWDVSKMA